MRSNRRSVLIGLGTLTVGGGAAFGTGAFSSVEADRTVTVNTAGDNSALLTIEEGTSYDGVSLTNGDSGAVTIEFTELNENAITTFENAVDITNTGTQTVDVSVTDSPTDLTVTVNNGGSLGNGETANLSFTVDLSGESSDADGTITVEAN